MIDCIKLNTNTLIKFRIVGEFESSEYQEKIISMQENNQLEYIPSVDNVVPIIKTSDAIINPSYHEGMSNILLEAAASGRPILASNIPGCKEIIDNGKNGYLFEPKNVDSILDTINKFVNLSLDDRKEMGLKGRLIVEKQFNRKKVVEKI